MTKPRRNAFGGYVGPNKRIKIVAGRIRNLQNANTIAEVITEVVDSFGGMIAMSDYWMKLVRDARETLEKYPDDKRSREFMQDSILAFFKLAEVNTITKTEILSMIEELDD